MTYKLDNVKDCVMNRLQLKIPANEGLKQITYLKMKI